MDQMENGNKYALPLLSEIYLSENILYYKQVLGGPQKGPCVGSTPLDYSGIMPRDDPYPGGNVWRVSHEGPRPGGRDRN